MIDGNLINVEIGKETLKNMMPRVSLEGSMNFRDEVIPIGQGDDERKKGALKERVKEQTEMERRKAKAQVPVHRPSVAHPPRPERSPSPVDLRPSPAFLQLQADVQKLKASITSMGQYLVKIERTILSLSCYNPIRATQETLVSVIRLILLSFC